MPLIASGYLWLAAGLLLGFSGLAWAGVVLAVLVGVVALIRREIHIAALGLMLLGGAVDGLSAARPTLSTGRAKTANDSSMLDATRLRASRSIDRLFGRDAPMAKALLIADQHDIPPEVRDRYARAGMVHMLSISGLHVAIVAGAVALLLQIVRLPRKTATILSVFVTAMYVA
ncbi:MAG: ComEC/Rec2 family competence protein, partial [Gemmatimonadaceae bacterium]